MNGSEKFRIGDRVVHVTPSEVPEGAVGTVLGPGWGQFIGRWEVEFDDHPCEHIGRASAYPEAKSTTSWISRETSIELTREEVRRREAEKEAA